MIRRDPHDADVAQARVFAELLSAAIAEASEAVEIAVRDATSTDLVRDTRAQRQADQVVADLRELKRQLTAIQRRFPAVRMETMLHAVSA